MNREELSALTPQAYLASGFRDPSGAPRAELTGLWSLAAMQQLRAAGVTPAELESALTQLRPVAMAQATSPLASPDLLTLRAALQSSPKALRSWLGALIDGVRAKADLRPLLAHAAQTLALLALADASPRQPS